MESPVIHGFWVELPLEEASTQQQALFVGANSSNSHEMPISPVKLLSGGGMQLGGLLIFFLPFNFPSWHRPEVQN